MARVRVRVRVRVSPSLSPSPDPDPNPSPSPNPDPNPNPKQVRRRLGADHPATLDSLTNLALQVGPCPNLALTLTLQVIWVSIGLDP